jgi:hypothetical protein
MSLTSYLAISLVAKQLLSSCDGLYSYYIIVLELASPRYALMPKENISVGGIYSSLYV